MPIITSLVTLSTYSTLKQIVQVVFEAAADGIEQLLYIAGEDANVTYAKR